MKLLKLSHAAYCRGLPGATVPDRRRVRTHLSGPGDLPLCGAFGDGIFGATPHWDSLIGEAEGPTCKHCQKILAKREMENEA